MLCFDEALIAIEPQKIRTHCMLKYDEQQTRVLEQALNRFDSSRTILESQTPYDHQVAGHTKEILCKYNGYILKPLVKPDLFIRELSLYEDFESQYPDDNEKFMFAKYYGAAQATTQLNGVINYIVLADLTLNCKIPCIIDIKMGQQTFEPTVSENKKIREKQKYIYQEEIGFRITGLKVFDSRSRSYTITDKKFGRSLLPQQVLHGLALFYYNDTNLRADVLVIVIDKLQRILSWMLVQARYQFYCSSILIIYEGDLSSTQDLENTVQVKMIDLAHTITVDGLIDSGYIHGLRNLIGYFEQLKDISKTEGEILEEYRRIMELISTPELEDCVYREQIETHEVPESMNTFP